MSFNSLPIAHQKDILRRFIVKACASWYFSPEYVLEDLYTYWNL